MIIAGNRKRVALMTVCRIVDSQVSGLNSSKAQWQRGIGRVLSAKTIRTKKLKELAVHIKNCAATDVMIAGDFNESVRSENIMNSMNETGLHDVLTETNGVEIENREATYQHDRKCIDHVLAVEEVLSKVKGCELSEWTIEGI